MLKYVSKFALDILPSVVATIIGAYIVNHYIVAKPADAPAAAAVSTDRSPKSRPRRRQHSRIGRQGEGHLGKGAAGEDGVGKARCRRQAGGNRKPACRAAPGSAGAA